MISAAVVDLTGSSPSSSNGTSTTHPSSSSPLSSSLLPADPLLRRVHIGKCLQLLYPQIFSAGVLPTSSLPLTRVREAIFHGIQAVKYSSLEAFRTEVRSLITTHACPKDCATALLNRVDHVVATARDVEMLYSHGQGLPQVPSRRRRGRKRVKESKKGSQITTRLRLSQ